jgi:nitroreductase / dihydropteridine reductase
MDIIEKLNWRYATKIFDPNKKLSKEQVDTLVTSANLTATSFGLQPCKLILVENMELREELVQHSWGQKQVKDASHLLVIARYDNLGDQQVDEYVDRMASARGIEKESLEGMSTMVKNFLAKMSEEEKASWSSNQAHIIMGNLLNTCAIMNIDSCPIAGFIPAEYDRVLELEKDNLKSVLVLPVGHRMEEDKYSKLAKVRMSDEEFKIIK